VMETTAVAPTGITVPFAPITGSAISAVNRSPTLLVFVQMRWPAASDISDPVETTPSLPSDPLSVTRSVLPLAVVRTVGAAGAGAGAGLDAVVVLFGVVRLTTGATVRRGAGAGSGSDAIGCGSLVTGTSRSSGLDAVSWLASARSRTRLVSCASGSPFLRSLHAAVTAAAASNANKVVDLIFIFVIT